MEWSNTNKKAILFESMRDDSDHVWPCLFNLVVPYEREEQILVTVCRSVFTQNSAICHGLLYKVRLSETLHEDIEIASSLA